MRRYCLNEQALLLLIVLVSSHFASAPVWGVEAAPVPQTGIPAQLPTGPVASEADIKTIKARLLAAQIVTSPEALQTLTSDAIKARGALRDDGKWPGLAYADTGPGDWGPSLHMNNVLLLARAYATPGQPLYHDASLLEKINLAYDTFFAGNYVNANWWYNDIGVPLKVGSILLLLEDVLSENRKAQGLANLKRSDDDKPMRKATGANLSWLARIQLMRGLAQPSPRLVGEAFDAMWSEIKISPQGTDGIQADGSFHQHGPLPYNGGYGTSFTSYASDFYFYARDTSFALPAEKERILIDFLLDGQDWMAWGNDFDPSVRGREITRDRSADKPSNWRQIPALLAQGTNWRRNELLEMSQRLEPQGKKRLGNRNFWDSDFMVQRSEGYYTSVRMHSTRTRNTDGASKEGGPINREGRLSHHVADGATYLFQRGDEYEGVAPVWNWNLIPGTTAQQVPALDESHVAFKGTTSFVGGVSDGMYGAATMDFQRTGLRAKKSWFYFDDEFVALGAGITDTTENPIATAVNQSLLHGDVRLSNLTVPLPQGEYNEAGARWVLHDGTGYLFPAGNTLRVSNRTRSGRWSDSGSGSNALVSKGVFSLSLDHGVRPQEASYEYIVVPNTNAAALNARLVRSSIATLANTPDLQAVRHSGLKIVQAVFHRPGALTGGQGWNFQVDAPCLVMMREVAGGVEIAVSNPENKPLAVNLEIDRPLAGEGASVQGNLTTIHFDLPGELLAGSSVVRVFKRNP